MEQFSLNRGVRIQDMAGWTAAGEGACHEAVKRAVARFYRDMEMTLEETGGGTGKNGGTIYLEHSPMDAEQYQIHVKNRSEVVIRSGDELGLIYALLSISERYLGIHPFWFWNDQIFLKRDEALIPAGIYESVKKPVAYRGWFINDEVLLSHWDAGRDASYPWEMAFEALLRCGGNVVIPGTDRNSKRYAGLASAMGLWITHHHAEPLGAEMFARAYPDKTPSFREYPELFRGLWEEGIKRQKDQKVIWNLGFRGQGDTPFWENDPHFDTPEKRGRLISSIIEEQYELVKQQVEAPICCTNLYGEVMELYRQGYLTLPDGIIMVWADNGYGKMVSRRQGNHNPRIPALPEKSLQKKRHGVYYHVSFYDLQAANVLTMIPNSMEFVEQELRQAYDCGIQDLWLVNCSNIKPHVYPLDFVASLWNGGGDGTESGTGVGTGAGRHLERYLHTYYGQGELAVADGQCDQSLSDERKLCFQEYFQSMLPYGDREDEHAGEQFYNYVARILIHGWMKDGGASPCPELAWCAPFESYEKQMFWFRDVCNSGRERLQNLLHACGAVADRGGRLWADSILLQVKIHAWCVEGVLHFAAAYEAYKQEKYKAAFYELGMAADWYQAVEAAMEECCHDKWKGFYENDCQTDIGQTAYLLRLLMGYVRNLGDGPYFYMWQREALYSEEDRRVVLLTNEEKHLTDMELYRAMRGKTPLKNCALPWICDRMERK